MDPILKRQYSHTNFSHKNFNDFSIFKSQNLFTEEFQSMSHARFIFVDNRDIFSAPLIYDVRREKFSSAVCNWRRSEKSWKTS